MRSAIDKRNAGSAPPFQPFGAQDSVNELIAPYAVEPIILDKVRLDANRAFQPSRQSPHWRRPTARICDAGPDRRNLDPAAPKQLRTLAAATCLGVEDVADLSLQSRPASQLEQHFAKQDAICRSCHRQPQHVSVLCERRRHGSKELRLQVNSRGRRCIQISIDLRSPMVGRIGLKVRLFETAKCQTRRNDRMRDISGHRLHMEGEYRQRQPQGQSPASLGGQSVSHRVSPQQFAMRASCTL